MNPEEKITDDPMLKQWYIRKDKRALEIAEKTKHKKADLFRNSELSFTAGHP